tara:strand:+ start:989 stop:1195 length:207 start_codon:yes stop_codon:yes gene_type:complete
MKLKDYLNFNNIKSSDFAETLGESAGYIRQIKSGHRNAGLALAIKIQKATSKAVTVEDMVVDKYKGAD